MIKIRDWEKHFEKDRTKQWKRINWVPIPNKQGVGYRKIMKHQDGLKIFACWIALIEIASTVSPRGDLSKYTLADLSDLTMINDKDLLFAISYLSQDLDWIIKTTNLDTTVNAIDTNVNAIDSIARDTAVDSSIQFNSIQSSSSLINKLNTSNTSINTSTSTSTSTRLLDDIDDILVDDKQVMDLYQLYPRKIEEPFALTAIRAALKISDFETIKAGVIKYAASVKKTAPKYVSYPAKWFSAQRWKDIEHRPDRDGGTHLFDGLGDD